MSTPWLPKNTANTPGYSTPGLLPGSAGQSKISSDGTTNIDLRGVPQAVIPSYLQFAALPMQNKALLDQINTQGSNAQQLQSQAAAQGINQSVQNQAGGMADLKEQGSQNLGLAQLAAATQMGGLKQSGMNDLGMSQQTGLNSLALQQAKNSGLLGFGGMLFNALGSGGLMGGLKGVQGNTGQSAFLPGASFGSNPYSGGMSGSPPASSYSTMPTRGYAPFGGAIAQPFGGSALPGILGNSLRSNSFAGAY